MAAGGGYSKFGEKTTTVPNYQVRGIKNMQKHVKTENTVKNNSATNKTTSKRRQQPVK